MTKELLTKSDFKIAQSCPTKLFYKKNKYPNINEINEYMRLLSEGGYMVGKMAQLLHEEGIEVHAGPEEEDLEKSIEETKEYLKKEKITLFESAFLYRNIFNRVDILIKNENTIEVIEIKSKSYNSTKGDRQFDSVTWREYLEDISFQVYVLQKLYPNFQIKPFLILPDKSKRTKIEGLAGWFQIRKDELKKNNYIVDFTGDIEKLREEDLLTKIDVTDKVNEIILETESSIELFSEYVLSAKHKIEPQISKHCKDCEFRDHLGNGNDGFHECWEELANVKPHILELYRLSDVGGRKLEVGNRLISEGKVSLCDIPEDILSGVHGRRQLIQIQNTKNNSEWFSPDLKDILSSYDYPLYFIDFETSRSAIPFHKNMRPYEDIAFQWSCHKIEKPGEAPKHSEWLNLEDTFPNFKFAESLMKAVGNDGTVFMWASHENTTLKNIYFQMDLYDYKNPELKEWLEEIVKFTKDDKDKFYYELDFERLVKREQNGRLVDMNALALNHYFHPEMKGSTSIKYVLPSIWKNNPYLHQIEYLKPYLRMEGEEILSPYKTLDPIEVAGQAEVVQEGTGAMKAYQEMHFGLHAKDLEIKKKWKNLLLQYCELDTMAMVIIWLHWGVLSGVLAIDSIHQRNEKTLGKFFKSR